MDERRKSPRHIAMKGGHIRFEETATDRDCVVIDLSPGGAQIELPAVAGIPSEFILTVDGNPAYDCFVRWRTPHRLGVTFLPPHSASLHS